MRQRSSRKRKAILLQVEQLEDRVLLSASRDLLGIADIAPPLPI